jgi:hypothetical protein
MFLQELLPWENDIFPECRVLQYVCLTYGTGINVNMDVLVIPAYYLASMSDKIGIPRAPELNGIDLYKVFSVSCSIMHFPFDRTLSIKGRMQPDIFK